MGGVFLKSEAYILVEMSFNLKIRHTCLSHERGCFPAHLHSQNKVRREHNPRFLVRMSKECLWNQTWAKTALVLAATFGASNRKIAKSLFFLISLNINHSLIHAKNNCAHSKSKMQTKIQIYNFIMGYKLSSVIQLLFFFMNVLGWIS